MQRFYLVDERTMQVLGVTVQHDRGWAEMHFGGVDMPPGEGVYTPAEYLREMRRRDQYEQADLVLTALEPSAHASAR